MRSNRSPDPVCVIYLCSVNDICMLYWNPSLCFKETCFEPLSYRDILPIFSKPLSLSFWRAWNSYWDACNSPYTLAFILFLYPQGNTHNSFHMTNRFILFLTELRINDRAQWPSQRKPALQPYYYKIRGRTNFPSSPALAVGELCKGKKMIVRVMVDFTFGSCVLTTCEVGLESWSDLSHPLQAGKMVTLCWLTA